jgi:hypothetical protein
MPADKTACIRTASEIFLGALLGKGLPDSEESILIVD